MKAESRAYFVLQRHAQPICFEIQAGRPSRCAHAINGANNIDKGDSFNALAVHLTAGVEMASPLLRLWSGHCLLRRRQQRWSEQG